jgi:uncharacterized protein (DUF697 family)
MMVKQQADYDKLAFSAMKSWQQRMKRKPSLSGRLARRIQQRVNRMIPEKVQKVLTGAIREMTKAMVSGAGIISSPHLSVVSLEETEKKVSTCINLYKKTAAAEGAATGAGGFLSGLADFPLWLSIKIKMLAEIAGIYGYDISLESERLYILYIFQLALSGQEHRNQVFNRLEQWDLSDNTRAFQEMDWRRFQMEYRDYIDLAKFFQLVPGIGAVVGAYVNHSLTEQLGETAMQAYRMRWFKRNGDQ